MQRISRAVLGLALPFLCACGGSAPQLPAPVPVLTGLAVTPASVALAVGQRQPLSVSGVLSDGSTSVLSGGSTFISSAEGVATVSAGGVVVANAPGSALITLAAQGLTASVPVTVTARAPGPVLLSVSLTPAQAHVDRGATLQLALSGTYDSGAPQDLTSVASFSSSAPGVVSVSPAGLVTALANGSAAITASVTVGDLTKSATAEIAAGLSTAGQIFFAGAYAADVSFVDLGGALPSVSLDAATQDPAGHGSLKFVLPASGFAGGTFLAQPARDLSGYDAVTFWAKASAAVSLEKAGLGDNAGLAGNTADVEADGLALTTAWQKFTLPLPAPASFAQAFGLLSLRDGTNHGVTVWLSDLQYEKVNPGAPVVAFTSTSRTVQSGLTAALTPADLKLHYPNIDLFTPNLAYFGFSSDAPAVATVSAAGVISGVSVGSANISASLNGVTSTNKLAVTVGPAGYDPGAGWNLVWSDEFDGTSVDPASWTFDIGSGGWGNNESEYYRAENAVVAGGNLTITAKLETFGDALYTSARLQTSQKKTFTYGKFSMRAKLPYSQAMWPAFWMLGADSNSQNGIYGGNVTWPGCGEIDIMEMIGGLSDNSGDYTTHGTLHYLNAQGRNPAPSYAYRTPNKLADEFHVYEVVWTPHSFTWKIDGLAYGTKIVDPDMTAFSKPMFILLNLAVGGPWGGWVDGSTVFPQTYVIDYVRVYTNASATDTGPAGLASNWHLLNGTTTGITPATENLQSAPGTVSGFQPLKTLTSPATWYSGPLTGRYEDGAWQLALFTAGGSGSSVVKAEAFLTAADGTSPVSLGAAQVDVNKTGAGNHRSFFSFPGVPALPLANQRIKVVLTPVSGTSAQMIYNGNDFDSVLTAPFSPGH